MNLFNEDYFENGIEKGISLYSHYHWMPERSFKEAHWFIQYMNINLEHLILDFGCAKGYFVKAMRLLGYKTFGIDISDYALKNCDEEVKQYISSDTTKKFDSGFCKDVLEHSPTKEELIDTLRKMKSLSDNWLIVVPVAKDGKFIVKELELDITHHIRYTKNEWLEVIGQVFPIKTSRFNMYGIKDKWNYVQGDLFIITGNVSS